jgi:hypothetical protein
MALATFLSISMSDAQKACDWLKTRKYVWKPRGAYQLTDTGLEFLSGLRENPVTDAAKDAYRWKMEALTGITNSGKRSEIKSAVLPTGKMPHETRTPEDIIMDKHQAMKSRENLARYLGVDLDTLKKHIRDGRLRHCKHCDSPGIFDKSMKNGRLYWRSMCRKCRKKRRK